MRIYKINLRVTFNADKKKKDGITFDQFDVLITSKTMTFEFLKFIIFTVNNCFTVIFLVPSYLIRKTEIS